MSSLPTSYIPRRKGRALAGLGALALLCALLSLCLGAVPVPPGDILPALLGRGEDSAVQIVRYARLPRTCACLLAGSALAVSGAVIQGVLGNPLAAPNIIGVSSGAGLGAAVSFSGLIGFVGLIVPHIMRRLTGEDSLPLLAGCALGGAACLTLCDLLSRLLFAPYELPVGIVLSLAGGPFFLWLLLRQRGGRAP